MNLSDVDSTVATAYRIERMMFNDDYYNSQIDCEVSTGRQYLTEHSIDSIDLLKVDVEGMDLKVLKCFGDKIQSVKVIHFKYEIFNISSHDLLCGFFVFLEKYRFEIGKVYLAHLHFLNTISNMKTLEDITPFQFKVAS